MYVVATVGVYALLKGAVLALNASSINVTVPKIVQKGGLVAIGFLAMQVI